MKKIVFLLLAFVAILAMSACGKGQNSNISLDEVVIEIKDVLAEDLKANGVDEPVVDGKLSGYLEVNLTNPQSEDEYFIEQVKLDKDLLEAGYAIVAMMNVNSDEMIVLQAKDSSNVQALKEALESERDAQVQTWEQYLPDQYEKVKNNIIKTKGNYLIYITYNQPEKIEAVFDSKLK